MVAGRDEPAQGGSRRSTSEVKAEWAERTVGELDLEPTTSSQSQAAIALSDGSNVDDSPLGTYTVRSAAAAGPATSYLDVQRGFPEQRGALLTQHFRKLYSTRKSRVWAARDNTGRPVVVKAYDREELSDDDLSKALYPGGRARLRRADDELADLLFYRRFPARCGCCSASSRSIPTSFEAMPRSRTPKTYSSSR